MKTLLSLCLLAALSLAPAISKAGEPLTVVEMFTSQGCSSCPPADALLGDLAKRKDIVALSMHVDYWDYIGWKDPFALPINAARQRVYARKMGASYVYTPQAVVQGMAHTTGSSRRDIDQLIQDVRGAKRVAVTATRSGDGVRIAIAGGVFPGEEATVYVASVDARHETEIRRGENAGHTFTYTNVVREMDDVATWHGDAAKYDIPAGTISFDGHDAGVVLVQSNTSGRILGAAWIVAASGS